MAGLQTRGFCLVDDLVEAILRMMAMDPKITGPVNISNPGEFSMRELADLVVDLTSGESNIVSRPLTPDDPRQHRPDITLAKEVLGWEPRVALREGLRKTIDYFDAFLSEEGSLTREGVRD